MINTAIVRFFLSKRLTDEITNWHILYFDRRRNMSMATVSFVVQLNSEVTFYVE